MTSFSFLLSQSLSCLQFDIFWQATIPTLLIHWSLLNEYLKIQNISIISHICFSVAYHNILLKYSKLYIFSIFCFCVLLSQLSFALGYKYWFFHFALASSALGKRLKLIRWRFAFSLTTTLFLLRFYWIVQTPSLSMTVVRLPLSSVTLSSRPGKHDCSLSSFNMLTHIRWRHLHSYFFC